MNNLPFVGIVILNYKNWEDTLECIESILKLKYANYRIIVVDNKSPNNSMDYLIKWANNDLCHFIGKSNLLYKLSLPPYLQKKDFVLYKHQDSYNKKLQQYKITFIQSEENRGYASGNNIGISHIIGQQDCEYIWLLNNDIVVNQNTLCETIDEINNIQTKFPDIKTGLFGHRITYYAPPYNTQASFYSYNKYLATTKSVVDDTNELLILNPKNTYPTGASIFISLQFVSEVGKMCEDYFLYYEEPDWSIRASFFNYSLIIFNKSQIYHKEGASAGSSTIGIERSYMSDFYSLSNRLKFTRNFYPKYIIPVKVGLFIALLNRILRNQFDRAKLIMKLILGIK